MGVIKEIVISWIAGRQTDFGSVTMSFVDMTDSSIRLKVKDRIIQVIIPSSFQLEGCASSSISSSGEVFLVTCVGCTFEDHFENMLMTLNEKIERIAIQPDSLSQVLDHVLLALQKYEKCMKGKADSLWMESQSTLMEGSSAQFNDACDNEDEVLLSEDDECYMTVDSSDDDNCFDHYGYNLAACENESSAAHIQSTTSGFLYAMAECARLECESARETVTEKELISDAFEQSSSLAWCHVLPDPKLLTVNLLIHVGGIVRDDSLASALGISVNIPVKIALLFDQTLWVQQEKVLIKPHNDACKVTQEASARLNDLAKEPNEHAHSMSYGNGVLLPKLVRVFFQFLSNDTIMLEEKPKSQKIYDELHQFTSMENTFVGLLSFLCARMKTLQDWCIVCLNSLPYSVCRLRTCDKELCLFTFEEVGVGAPVLQEVQTSPEVIDFELSLALVAANSGRDVFEPFPTFLLQREQLRQRSGWFSKAQKVESANTAQMASSMHVGANQYTMSFSSNKNMILLKTVISSIPPVKDMQKCRDEAGLRTILNSVWEKLVMERQSKWPKEPPENLSWVNVKSLPYSVLRYILSTSRVKLHLLEPDEKLPFFDSHYQFVLLHDSPEREAYFESRRLQMGGSFFAFHGSSAENWYSILRNGLRCLSNTFFMTAGASHGSGIYFSSLLEVSMRFCAQRGSGWHHGPLKEGFSVLAICEIIKGSIRSEQDMRQMKERGIMVVPPEYEKDVAIRYVVVLGQQYGRGEVYINGSEMPGNIDLMRHYLSLRSSYGVLQQEQRRTGCVEHFRYMCKLGQQTREQEEERKESSCAASKDEGNQIDPPKAKASYQSPSMALCKRTALSTTGASASSMQAIAREYKNIVRQTMEAKERIKDEDFSVLAGLEVILPDESNIRRWHVKLSQSLFKQFPLYKDLVDCARQWNVPEVSIKLECMFPENYPFSPPFIRVISPKFGFHTGHVTVGGSICMELLTASGWSPVYTFESIIVQIVNAMIEGGGRLDKAAVITRSEYSEFEAREAFDRVARAHGWSIY